ncbi:MAG: hypothetical protein V3T71_00845, partial [Dehalococcoidia bacterium]
AIMDREVRNLWARDFDLVEKGLSEPQVVAFVNELLGRRGSPGQKQTPLASLTKLVERMVTEADKLAAEIKAEAKAEAASIRETARAEAAQIEAEARQEAELLTSAAKHFLGDEVGAMKDDCQQLLAKLESLASGLPGPKASSLPGSSPPEPEPAEAPASDPTQPPAPAGAREEIIQAPSQLRSETEDQAFEAAPEPAVAPMPSLGQPDEEDAALYEGQVELSVAPSTTSDQLMGLQQGLQQITDVRVMRTSGSPVGGTTITVLVQKPLPLARVLKGISCVKSCVKEMADGEVERRSTSVSFFKKAILGQRPKPAPENRILIALG